MLEKGGFCPRWVSQRNFYFNRSSIISMVETFRASWPSPTISVPKFTCFDKPPWKKRLFTTSATSTAVLMALPRADRKSTRLNSSHLVISYAVFCLKKKKNKRSTLITSHIHFAYTPVDVTDLS